MLKSPKMARTADMKTYTISKGQLASELSEPIPTVGPSLAKEVPPDLPRHLWLCPKPNPVSRQLSAQAAISDSPGGLAASQWHTASLQYCGGSQMTALIVPTLALGPRAGSRCLCRVSMVGSAL